MIKDIKIFKKTFISLLCLIAVLATPASHAGDEDMSPNAYHIFDPETGYMITVESVPEGQQSSLEPDAFLDAGSPDDQIEGTEKSNAWVYVLTAIVVAVGFTAWKRNREKISGTNF